METTATRAAAWLAARAGETASATASSTESAASASSSAGLSVGSNPAFKIVGVCLAIGSGLFIGSSFVIKKKGLIKSTEKHGNAVGEGHAYLKSWLWWTGMIMMVVGEILNFVAYAFTVAILVTAMGSISVVVAAILSHFFLKETLTFFGWIGCTLCVLGSIILALNAPHEQSVRTISEFKKLFLSPGFLVWAGLCIVGSLVVVFYVAPRWGKKNMMPYISVCSLIGGISVSCTQGLGSAIITSIQGDNQVKNWFFWFLFFFVVITLLVEINYLNKALELFNTSMVVPVYFCYFTSATMVTSFILYKGLKTSAVALVTIILGFLVTCFGITLLQMSKVDPAALTGLDRRSTMLLQASKHTTEAEEKGDVAAMEEPGMDALRGGFGAAGSIIRARSISRRMSTRRGSEGFGVAQHNTAGLAHLPRYQLSDNPMPNEEHIAMSPQATGTSLRPPASFISPEPTGASGRQSSLKFDTEDMVHEYAYTEGGRRGTGHSDAFHRIRQSSGVSGHTASSSPMPLSPLHQPPTPTEKDRYIDPYLHTLSQPSDHHHHQPERKTSFSQLFLGIAGGGGGRDYPPLRGDKVTERDERAALVSEPQEMDDSPVSSPEQARHDVMHDDPASSPEQAPLVQARHDVIPYDPASSPEQLPLDLRDGDLGSRPRPEYTRTGSAGSAGGAEASRRPMGPRKSGGESLSIDTGVGPRPMGPR